MTYQDYYWMGCVSLDNQHTLLMLCLHITSACASTCEAKNGLHDTKWRCLHVMFAFQRIPILCMCICVTIDSMLNFDADARKGARVDVTCKQGLILEQKFRQIFNCFSFHGTQVITWSYQALYFILGSMILTLGASVETFVSFAVFSLSSEHNAPCLAYNNRNWSLVWLYQPAFHCI